MDIPEDLKPVTALPGVETPVANVNIVTNSVVGALRESQNKSLIITLSAAMLLLVADFWYESRRPFLGIITILPVAFVVLWTFEMGGARHSFGPVTAPLGDRHRRSPFDPRDPAVLGRPKTTRRRGGDALHHLKHGGAAIAGSAFTTLAGFGVFMTSGLIPSQPFGAVAAIAIGFSLLASVGVLPSMLVLWDRWHRRRHQAR